MAVVTTGEELFVNASWTTAKKVPAKSPYGVELYYEETPEHSRNAFPTLAEAIAYAESQSLTMVKFIDGDKTVAIKDATGEITYISAMEIKGTETEKLTKTGATYTGQSKQTAANKIAFDNYSAAAATTVAGFKEVTLTGGAAEFTVQGGANTVKHVYTCDSTAKGSTIKDSGTIAGKADGTLTVKGATVLAATGAWAEVQSENGAEITLDTEAFKAVYPGDPASIDWDVYGESVLPDLPGYATVTLTGGASAAVLLGGTFDFTRATDAVYTVSGESDYLSSLNKTLKYSLKNSGKLTVTDSVVGEARGYATVAVSGESADFDELNSDAFATTIKTTYKDTRSAKNTTVKETSESTSTESAAGTLTAENIGLDGETDRDVTGFSKVTVKDARLGMVRATGGKYTDNETRETVTTPIAGGSSVKVTATGSYSGSDTATGSLATAKGNTSASFKSIMGYSKVELTNATVEQDIRIAGGGRPGSYSDSMTKTTVDEKLMLSKTVNKEDYAAAGTVTMSGGSVGWRIEGAATVKLTGTTVSGGIIDGGTWKENYSKELSINSKTNALTNSYSSSSANQLKGTVTMTGGAVEGSYGINGIIGYQTVTLDGAAVAGGINDSESHLTTSSSYKNEFSSSFVDSDGIVSGATLTKQTWSSGYSCAPATTLTLKNGAVVSGDVYGVKTLNVSAGCTVGGDVDMYSKKNTVTNNITSKNGVYEQKYQSAGSRTAAGTVNITGGFVSAIGGATKVTAKDAVVSGALVTSNVVSSKGITAQGKTVDAEDGRYNVDTATATAYTSTGSNFTSATGAATLTDTTVSGGILGFATVKLTGGDVANVYGGNMNDSWTYAYKNGKLDYKRSSNSFVTGKLDATNVTFTGEGATVIRGFATVNLTSCIFGGSGSISGGSNGLVATGTADGANFAAAEEALVKNSVKSFAAAGTLTAKNSELGGIQNMATVNLTDCTTGNIAVNDGNTAKTALTLAGNNFIGGTVPLWSIQGINTVNVKSGRTMVDKGFLGTAKDDTITVAAKSELDIEGAVKFGDGVDSLTVNGTFRAGGWFNAESLEKLSGTGLLALTDVSAKYLLDEIAAGNIKASGKFEIVAAGNSPDDVLAVRTKKEELADNEAKNARKFDGEEMAGWLCGIEDADRGMFADTEDWIAFHNIEGGIFEVALTDVDRKDQIKVEIWQGGEWKQDIAWDDMTERFEIAGFAAGDYQLRLTTEAVTNGFSYFFGVKALG